MVNLNEYLGNTITEDGTINAKQQSKKFYFALNRTILGKKKVVAVVKLKMYNTITLPTIQYVSENWVIQKKHKNKFNGIEMKYLKRIAIKRNGVEY